MSPQYRDRIEGRTRPSFTRTSEVYAISMDNQTLEKISWIIVNMRVLSDALCVETKTELN